MFFNNGIVIEVLLFPKQFLIVLGLVSDDTQSPASLAKRCCYFVRKGTNYNINNKRKRKEKTLIIR